jgi:hypothetical protein
MPSAFRPNGGERERWWDWGRRSSYRISEIRDMAALGLAWNHAIHANIDFWLQQRDKPHTGTYRPTDCLEQANHDAVKEWRKRTPSPRHQLCRCR